MKAYQLKVAILYLKPPIWRRCIVPAGISIFRLTIILRAVMGEPGSHLSGYKYSSLRLLFAGKMRL
ncbi:IS1096 element passenger TnpR family protein [Butyrivibrio sp. INlla14]|uniref:IS1096 element passenger TnpR family protein n=1 Tax=Butyrivibrio sp. INlla14 TaxID=1520808 RepID=UPI000B8511F8